MVTGMVALLSSATGYFLLPEVRQAVLNVDG